MKLSVIIPSYKDPLLHKTIDDLLFKSELGKGIEIIAVLDGYWTVVKNDPRVRVVHLGKNRGMREAINAGVAVARGEFLMRCDEHQMFGQGYDRILTETCESNWIVTPLRYFLDPLKWEVMDLPPVGIQKLKIGGNPAKFAGINWDSRNEEFKNIPIVETMAMQGSCWLMPHKWWEDVIEELQTEGYGPLYQDSHEMVFKAWKAGGKLMVNKNTWHAHKHRSFPRTHSNGTKENPSNNEACWAYSIKVWGEYYEKEIRPLWRI